MKKRHFLLMGLGGFGALTVGWGFLPVRQRLTGVALSFRQGQIALNAWLKLNPDGAVTLVMPKSEMGQGVFTALSMLVAEELGVPLAHVRIEQSPIDRLYGNVAATASGIPFRPDDRSAIARTARWTMTKIARELGLMMTGGSSSIKDLWFPLREASAMTRTALLNSVAEHWAVLTGSIALADGVFTSGDKRMTLGEVVTQLGPKIQPANSYRLKAMADFKLLGKPTPRVDTLGKINGSAMFGIDAAAIQGVQGSRLDFYAAILLSPERGGSVASMDTSAALTTAGVKRVITLPENLGGSGSSGGVAVVAAAYWQAKKALDAVKVEWAKAPASTWSNETVAQTLSTALAKEDGFTYYKQGDTQAALKTSTTKISATYSAPYLAHATMEPMNATVALTGRGAERKATVYVGTQVPDMAQRAAAKALGLSKDQVAIHVPFLGGGFGRRLETDVIAQAAFVAGSIFGNNDTGSVQLIWSRESDIQHDFYRPAAMAEFGAGLDAQGNLMAWVNKAASQNITPQYMPRNADLPLMGPDKTSIEGAFDQAYEFSNTHVAHVAVDMPIPVGFWRSVGHSHQAFFQEGFLDECAQATKSENPFARSVAFRRSLLKNHPRHLAVLDLAAERANEESKTEGVGTNSALGIALHESFGSIVAMVARVSMTENKEIHVHKITAAIDCGFCINPTGVMQQVESSVVFGLSAALWGKIDLKDGRVQQSNFHDYRVLRMSEMPLVETYIVPSTEPPEGMGEPALPPVAPAVANAVFALTGQRLRSLPLKLA